MPGRTPRVEVLPPESWAEAVAAALLDRLAGQPRLRLCLPTGDTPSPLYARLAALDAQAGLGGGHGLILPWMASGQATRSNLMSQ